MEVGEEGDYIRGRLYTYRSLQCHHQNDSCIKMGSDESHFNISLTVKDNVTRRSFANGWSYVRFKLLQSGIELLVTRQHDISFVSQLLVTLQRNLSGVSELLLVLKSNIIPSVS